MQQLNMALAKRFLRSQKALFMLSVKVGFVLARNPEALQDAWQKISGFQRLVKAFASNRYRTVTRRSVLWIVASLIYLLNPLDLIPDFTPLGLIDDLGVISFVFSLVGKEVERFEEWEKVQNGLSPYSDAQKS